ncbi:MAG: hypothetical protein WKF78_14355 [Candidatus Limnocylindrales bacterium]
MTVTEPRFTTTGSFWVIAAFVAAVRPTAGRRANIAALLPAKYASIACW